MLICDQCGHDNQLGRIFCYSCGAKLEISHIHAPTRGEQKRPPGHRGLPRAVRASLKWGLAGGVVLVLVLLGRVPAVAPVLPTNAALVAADGKYIDLQKLVNRQPPGQVTATAPELNAFIYQKPLDKPTGSDLRLVPVVRQISLHAGRIKVEILATAHLSTLYDKPLYFAYEGQPRIAGGHFVFQPTGAWLGHLPISPRLPVLLPLFAQRIASLLTELAGDQALLDKLTAINVTGDTVEFVKAAPAQP